MAKGKTLRIVCDAETAKAFARAIRSYAEAAYPPGGSECAQVANQALRESARKIDAAARDPDCAEVEIPRRQRVMLKTALEWYVKQPETDLPDTVHARLQRLFSSTGP